MRVKKLYVPLIIVFFLLFQSSIHAQGFAFSGSRSQALANASVCLTDVFSYHNNPANSSKIEYLTFGLSYENRFLLKELQHQSYAVAIPIANGVFTIGGNTFGYEDFRTFKNGIGYAMSLTSELSIGIQVNHHVVKLSGPFGNDHTLTGELGLSYNITPEWRLGIAVFNLGRNKLVEDPIERYTTSIRLGTAYKVSAKVLVVGEIEKDIVHPLRAKYGVEYQPNENLVFRMGFATKPIELSFGLGWVFSTKYFLDFGTQYHQILGWSPNISFRYSLLK